MPSLDRFVQDVLYALRIIRRNPAFATVAVLTLALGIGINSAIFSLFDAVLLRLLPVELLFDGFAGNAGITGTVIDKNVISGNTAYGWMSGARNSPAPSERLSCQVFGGAGGYRSANCYFTDSKNRSAGCFTSDPDMITAIQFAQSDSYISVAWGRDGACSSVSVYSDSAYTPKAP